MVLKIINWLIIKSRSYLCDKTSSNANSAFNSSESRSTLFCAEKCQKAPQFFFKKAPQYLPKAPHFYKFWSAEFAGCSKKPSELPDNFLDSIEAVCIWTLDGRYHPSCLNKMTLKFIKNLVSFLRTSKNFRRHKQSQKRHFGAKAPLLKALIIQN